MPTKLPDAHVIRTQRKTVALIINPDGKLVVRAPLKLSQQRIDEIIQQKAEWIRDQQAKMLLQQASTKTKQFVDGEELLYLGRLYPLRLIPKARIPLMLTSTQFELDQALQPHAARILEAWYRYQARLLFSRRCDLIAKQLGLKYERLRLSSARTRWGSCSGQGTISLAWRLVMAPMLVLDYVIIHELIHLRTHNHSKAFWTQVAEVMPNYRVQVNWLKEHGHELKL